MAQPEQKLITNRPVMPGSPSVPVQKKHDSLAKLAFEKFLRNKLAVAGSVVIILIVLAALLAPWLAPHNPDTQYLLEKLAKPSKKFPLGSDSLGRDTLSRLLYGARVSLLVSFSSVVGIIVIGTIVGSIAGYFGGIIDTILMRVVDIFISFPSLFLLIALVTIFQPSLFTLIFVFAFFSWMGTARLVRGEFLSLRTREFVLAARTMGVKNSKIIFSHILPNAIGPIIVSATLQIGYVILAEATLSFLGLGIQPPTPSWGNMLQDAQNITIMLTAWWYPLFPGLLILLTVLSFNFVGDGLRDAFDPKMK